MTILEWDQTDMAAWHAAHTAISYYRQGLDAAKSAQSARDSVKAG